MAKPLQIRWSPSAEISYSKTILYLLENWSLASAEAFNRKTEALLKKISVHKKLCPQSAKTGLRICVVNHQTSLVYRVTKDAIEIVEFIDNRSLHGF